MLAEKEVDVSRYSDRYTRKQTTTVRPPLNSVMTLTPNNFPSELYGKGGKGRGKNVLSGLSNVNKASEGEGTQFLLRFTQTHECVQ